MEKSGCFEYNNHSIGFFRFLALAAAISASYRPGVPPPPDASIRLAEPGLTFCDPTRAAHRRRYRYLLLTGDIELLPRLFDRALVQQALRDELARSNAPSAAP
jgi:hypothetical protein